MPTPKRVAFAALLTLVVAAGGLAAAQPAGPADPDEASPADLAAGAPATPEGDPPADGEEVEAEEVGEPIIDRGEPRAEVGFDKGFFIKSADGRYSMTVTGRVHPYYSLDRRSGPVDYRQAFEVRRARLVFDGDVHGDHLGYKLQIDFGRGVVTLKDFHFDLALADQVWLRVGQWKRPFSRQHITSSGRQELTDRAITDKAFGAGRDIGLALRNDYEKSPGLEWTVGVFNGTGDAARLTGTVEVDPVTGEGTITGGGLSNVPTTFRPAVIGRVGLNGGKIKGYSEADLEGGGLRWGAAASVWLEGDLDENDASNQKVELDYVVKHSGFTTTGGFYGMTAQTAAQTFSSQELAFVGFHLQAGYMVTPRVQLAARYALVDARLDDSKDQQELALGGSFYGHKHDAKLAAALRLFKNGDAGFGDAILLEVSSNVGW